MFKAMDVIPDLYVLYF